MMPELGMDMFDMATAPGMPNNVPEEEVLPAPEEMIIEPVQTAEAEALHDEHTAAALAMPSDQGLRLYTVRTVDGCISISDITDG